MDLSQLYGTESEDDCVNDVKEGVMAYFREGSGICLEELGKMTAHLG